MVEEGDSVVKFFVWFSLVELLKTKNSVIKLSKNKTATISRTFFMESKVN